VGLCLGPHGVEPPPPRALCWPYMYGGGLFLMSKVPLWHPIPWGGRGRTCWGELPTQADTGNCSKCQGDVLLGAGSCEQDGMSLRPFGSRDLMFRSIKTT